MGSKQHVLPFHCRKCARDGSACCVPRLCNARARGPLVVYKRQRWLRCFKLTLPCLTAECLGAGETDCSEVVCCDGFACGEGGACAEASGAGAASGHQRSVQQSLSRAACQLHGRLVPRRTCACGGE